MDKRDAARPAVHATAMSPIGHARAAVYYLGLLVQGLRGDMGDRELARLHQLACDHLMLAVEPDDEGPASGK